MLLSIGGFAQSWLSSSVVTLSLGDRDEDKGVMIVRIITRRGRIENTFLVTQEKAIASRLEYARRAMWFLRFEECLVLVP